MHTLRLGPLEKYFDIEDAKIWLCYAIKGNACVIQLKGNRNSFLIKLDPMDFVKLDSMYFVSHHLKVLKLSSADADDKFISKLLSGCLNLEELHLKGCLVQARKILSASLKRLIMVKCAFTLNSTVDCPNVVLLRCIAPQRCFPLFKNFGSLVTGSGMLDDSLFRACSQKHHKGDEFAQTSDEDEDNDSIHTSDDSDESSDDCDCSNGCSYSYSYEKDNYDYGSDIYSDTDTFEYSEVANGFEYGQFGKFDYVPGSTNGNDYYHHSAKYEISDDKKSGAQNVLHSLSNAQSLELLGHSGEVHLQTFLNLNLE